MQEKSKRSIVFGIVALVAVGSTIASAGIGGRARGKLAEATARMIPGGVATTPRAPVMPEYKLGAQDLEAARAAERLGDRAAVASALERVLERADRIDRAHTLASSLVAAKLFDGVADIVDADSALLDDSRLSSAVRRTAFSSSRRPLQGERLFALSVLAKVPSQVPIRTLGLAESTTTEAMNDVNASMREMENAAIAGDLAGCEEASQRPIGLAKQVMVGPSICRHVGQVVASGRRFDRLQAAAVLRSGHLPTKTARVTL